MSGMPYRINKLRGRYAIVWTDATGKRRRYQLDAADPVEAEAEARRRWAEAQTPTWPLDAIMEAYLADRESAQIATYARRVDAWRAMKPFWGALDPELIDEETAQAYDKWRRAAPATIRYELSQLYTAIKWGRKKNYTIAEPERWMPALPDRDVKHLTRAEFNKFLSTIDTPHVRLFVLIAISTCARPGAICELTWHQIKFENHLIDFNQPGRLQNKKRRPILPISDRLLPHLQEAYRGRLSDYVVEHHGKPVKTLKKAMQANSKRSGVYANQYTFRHTGAVWRAEEGIAMSELAQLMGHEDSRTTEKHYARFSPDFLRRAAHAGSW